MASPTVIPIVPWRLELVGYTTASRTGHGDHRDPKDQDGDGTGDPPQTERVTPRRMAVMARVRAAPTMAAVSRRNSLRISATSISFASMSPSSRVILTRSSNPSRSRLLDISRD